MVSYNLWRIGTLRYQVRSDWKKIDQETVIRCYENILKLMPGVERPQWMYLNDLGKMERYKEAVQVCEQLIKSVNHVPRQPNALTGLEFQGPLFEDPGEFERWPPARIAESLEKILKQLRINAALTDKQRSQE